jgi:hypothetical protein
MTTHEVIEAFARGEMSGGASRCKYYPKGRLRIEGDKLYNYNTVIAYWFNGIMLINGTRYSETTLRHQNRLKRQDIKKLVVDEDTLNEVMHRGSLYVDIIKDILRSEESSLDTKVKCNWCGEEFEGLELQQTSMGMLCDTCVRAIKSRGESI